MSHRFASFALASGAAQVLLLTSLIAGATPAARAQSTTFDFVFDGTFNSTVTPPIVGLGKLTFGETLGAGTYAYNSLGPVSLTFDVDGQVFTQNNIISDTSKTTIILTTLADGRERLQFSDTGSGANGPGSGSLDFSNTSGQFLSFEPSYYGGGLNHYASSLIIGNYAALTSVPEPGVVVTSLSLLGTTGMGLIRGRMRQKKSRAIG